jgi:SAM-dependent methyltransferase
LHAPAESFSITIKKEIRAKLIVPRIREAEPKTCLEVSQCDKRTQSIITRDCTEMLDPDPKITRSGFPAWLCPVHGCELRNGPEQLICSHDHAFEIVGGIPRFVESAAYADHFGLQWNTFRRTQLDSYTRLPISEDRLRKCLGEKLWTSLDAKQVLECGCGAGRFTEILLARGAFVTAVDLSDAVEAARENCGKADLPCRFAQADISQLPFLPREFDLVICIGVLQHTPNPELTIGKLWNQVKPGGHLVIDHYCFSGWRYYSTATPFFRWPLNRMSREAALRWTNRMVRLAFPLQRALRNHSLLSRLVARMFPVVTYFRTYPQLNDQLQFEWSLLDTHDVLTDGYKHSRDVDAIHRTLSELGGSDIEVWKGGNGVQARARRP